MSAGEQFHAYGHVHVDPHVAEAAVRAVHLRWKRGQLGDADAVEVLRALGLAPSGSGGRYTPTGRRDTRTEGKQRAAQANADNVKQGSRVSLSQPHGSPARYCPPQMIIP
jgi:hypothetical protein